MKPAPAVATVVNEAPKLETTDAVATPAVADAVSKPADKPLAIDPALKPANPVADAVDPFALPPAAKPADSKPTDTKPADINPADIKPVDAAPAEAKPADVKLPDVKPATEALPPPDAAKPAEAPVDDPFAPVPAAAKPAAKDSGSTTPPAAKITVAPAKITLPAKIAAPATPTKVVPVALAAKADKPALPAVENEAMRVWHDDTGEYEVRGRLILVLPGKVRLLKETGRTTTVPLDRLSPADLEYLHQHAPALTATLTAQSEAHQ